MLFRHIRPVFLQADFVDRPVMGPSLAVRPLDSDAPDHLMRFLFWAALIGRTPAPTPTPGPQPPTPGGSIARAQLLIEQSADGEGWTTTSTLDPRERPYLVTVGHMLPFVRVRLVSRAMPSRAFVQMLSNAPFTLDGPSAVMGGTP